MRFTATEAGFEDGVGGASNKEGAGERHYVLFGVQEDRQHPSNSGIYFEWDDEENGAVNVVRSVAVEKDRVVFTLPKRKTVTVTSGTTAAEDWAAFVDGVTTVFAELVDRR